MYPSEAVGVNHVLLPPLPNILAAPIEGCRQKLAPAVALPSTKKHPGV